MEQMIMNKCELYGPRRGEAREARRKRARVVIVIVCLRPCVLLLNFYVRVSYGRVITILFDFVKPTE